MNLKLLFCGIEHLAKRYPGCERRCEQLRKDLEKVGNPELINKSSETAPSKRIIKAIEGDKKRHYNYNKPVTGKDVAKSVCIDGLRTQCKHFDEWVKTDKLLIYCLYLRIKVKPALLQH